ncbi:MAG: Ig-like domain-containing protein [Gammaproteobacteria bacterium]
MRTIRNLISLAIVCTLVACSGGGDDDALTTPPVTTVDPTAPTPIEIASLEVLTSNPQIPSDGGVPVTITALLRDVRNNFIAGQNVTFSADSGGLSVTQADPTGVGSPTAITDETGRATAELSAAGDPTDRVITVTATSGDLSATVLVAVTGTQLTITGPSSLVQGATADFTLVLADAAGNGIANETVSLTSSLGNTLASTTLTTDFSGQAQVQYTAVNGGTDSLQASALGETAASEISISADTFTFTAPATNAEFNLNEMDAISVRWIQNNSPVVGQTVVFSTTRGTVSPASVVTDSTGTASTMITASNAGPATVTAAATGGPTSTLPIEFVAVTPDNIEVQADPFTVSPNSQSTITAVLRDANDNLVKNKSITFSLEDVTGGSLSVSSAITDSQGRAQTFYTSSATTSAVDGVTIRATVDENTTISDAINLTVAGREVFFTFGTGNTINEPTEAQYSKAYIVQVTDADGNAVSNVDVTMSIVSERYVKGFWWGSVAADRYVAFNRARCDDEDVNRNGILDPGEDFNNNNQIEAGNVATVFPGTFISDSFGEGNVQIRYAQSFGGWVEVELQARASVQGTEFSEKAFFILSVLADDINDLEQAPPGLLVAAEAAELQTASIPADTLAAIGGTQDLYELFSSPFGYNDDCSVWVFGD